MENRKYGGLGFKKIIDAYYDTFVTVDGPLAHSICTRLTNTEDSVKSSNFLRSDACARLLEADAAFSRDLSLHVRRSLKLRKLVKSHLMMAVSDDKESVSVHVIQSVCSVCLCQSVFNMALVMGVLLVLRSFAKRVIVVVNPVVFPNPSVLHVVSVTGALVASNSAPGRMIVF
jgi:hypothetical protein